VLFVIPVSYIDFRPLIAHIEGLQSVGADITKLPFANSSIMSLSCLHVAEHIGLGRYRDPLNPFGALIAARELCRVLAPGGNLYFSVPVGKPRLVFNSHRIHDADTILSYFSKLQLLELSGVHDNGSFVENVGLDEFNNSEYACGMFCLRKHE
jgi:SAM-dependent methyltransferase